MFFLLFFLSRYQDRGFAGRDFTRMTVRLLHTVESQLYFVFISEVSGLFSEALSWKRNVSTCGLNITIFPPLFRWFTRARHFNSMQQVVPSGLDFARFGFRRCG